MALKYIIERGSSDAGIWYN